MRIYRKYATETAKISAQIPKDLSDDLKKVTAKFAEAYPPNQYPSLSLIMAYALERFVARMNQDPAAMREAIKEVMKTGFQPMQWTPQERSELGSTYREAETQHRQTC